MPALTAAGILPRHVRPSPDAFDALALLRAQAQTRLIPVIALSAAASQHDQQRGLSAGFDRYMTKPMDVAEFETALRELLDATQVEAAPRAS